MKLVRYGPAGKEKPGLIDADGKLRDLSRKVKDIDAATLAPAKLRELAKLDVEAACRWSRASRASGACVGGVVEVRRDRPQLRRPRGRDRASPIPEHPIVFCKSTTCIVGPNDNVMIPKDSKQTDWEVELGVVIGRTARHVAEKDALRYVAGYCLINDVSEREFQLKKGGAQWTKGKGCDTFGPLGPVARHHRRDQGPAEPRHVARRQRRAQADRQHEDDDLRRRASSSPTSRAT